MNALRVSQCGNSRHIFLQKKAKLAMPSARSSSKAPQSNVPVLLCVFLPSGRRLCHVRMFDKAHSSAKAVEVVEQLLRKQPTPLKIARIDASTKMPLNRATSCLKAANCVRLDELRSAAIVSVTTSSRPTRRKSGHAASHHLWMQHDRWWCCRASDDKLTLMPKIVASSVAVTESHARRGRRRLKVATATTPFGYPSEQHCVRKALRMAPHVVRMVKRP